MFLTKCVFISVGLRTGWVEYNHPIIQGSVRDYYGQITQANGKNLFPSENWLGGILSGPWNVAQANYTRL